MYKLIVNFYNLQKIFKMNTKCLIQIQKNLKKMIQFQKKVQMFYLIFNKKHRNNSTIRKILAENFQNSETILLRKFPAENFQTAVTSAEATQHFETKVKDPKYRLEIKINKLLTFFSI